MLKSLKQGKEVEFELIEFLKSIGIETVDENTVYSDRYSHDVSCSNGASTLKFEVKHDVMATKTGNIAIEFWNSKQNKPSGISSTLADIWAHKFNGVIHLISVAKLKDLTTKIIPDKTVTLGGDKNSAMYIYKIERIQNEMVPINDITCYDDLLNIVSCTTIS